MPWLLMAKLTMLELGLLLGLALLVVVVMVLVLVVLAAAAAAALATSQAVRRYAAAAGKKLTVCCCWDAALFFFILLWLRMPRILAASGESGSEACAPAAAKLVRVLAPRRRQAASS